MTYLFTIILAAELGYLAILTYMYLNQRKYLFLPEKNTLPPSHYGLERVEDRVLITSDGVKLGAWFQPPPSPDGLIIVYFHGNAGHLGDRVIKMGCFLKSRFGICAPSYRSYGSSEGAPSEQGIYKDAHAAIAFLQSQGYKQSQMILYGESLGTGVATQMALECKKTRVLVLEAPYTATVDRAMERYPYLPVYLLMKDPFDTISKIPLIKTPILILHGELDEVMPAHHGKKILAAANEPKKGVFFPSVAHTDFDPQEICHIMQEFILTHPV